MHVRKQAYSAVLIALAWTAMPGAAQSLSLSYDVDVRRDSVERIALPGTQCTGSDWLNAVVPCASNGDAPTLSSQETGGPPTAGIRRIIVGTGGNAVPSPIPRQAFQGGDDLPDARLRGQNGSRAGDVSLRVGSKNRLLSPEESRESPRFVDAAYESYVQSNAHKAFGLELLVPFQ